MSLLRVGGWGGVWIKLLGDILLWSGLWLALTSALYVLQEQTLMSVSRAGPGRAGASAVGITALPRLTYGPLLSVSACCFLTTGVSAQQLLPCLSVVHLHGCGSVTERKGHSLPFFTS